jgi:hypothetical protein
LRSAECSDALDIVAAILAVVVVQRASDRLDGVPA